MLGQTISDVFIVNSGPINYRYCISRHWVLRHGRMLSLQDMNKTTMPEVFGNEGYDNPSAVFQSNKIRSLVSR